MNHFPTVLALIFLIAALAIAGALTGNAALITMAASVTTGMFAYLQVRRKN
jgi:hypothetical protein